MPSPSGSSRYSASETRWSLAPVSGARWRTSARSVAPSCSRGGERAGCPPRRRAGTLRAAQLEQHRALVGRRERGALGVLLAELETADAPVELRGAADVGDPDTDAGGVDARLDHHAGT